jgi:hypothetical protein
LGETRTGAVLRDVKRVMLLSRMVVIAVGRIQYTPTLSFVKGLRPP